MIDPNTKPDDFRRLDHMFPLDAKDGGILEFPRHIKQALFFDYFLVYRYLEENESSKIIRLENFMDDKIIIIGGGTGGLAMALFLEKAGIKSEVYEQAPEFSNVGASYAVHPNGVHVLDELGIGDQLRDNSHELSDFKLKNENGEVVYDLKSLDLEDTDLARFIYVARHYIIDILYQEAKRKGIKVHFSKKLQSLEQDDESVTAFFKDGTQAKGSLLIGADGTASRVRELIFPHQYLRYKGKWAVFGMGKEGELGEAEEILKQDDISLYLKEDFNIATSKHHPTDEEKMSWIFLQKQKRKPPKSIFEEKPTDEFKKEVAEKFSNFKDPIKEMILNSSMFFPEQVFDVGLMPKFSYGRVALIGDALQTTDPFSGMGATLSLEDGMYLAKMLRDHVDYEDAFYYYEYDRKDIVQHVHKETEELDHITYEELKTYFKGSDDSSGMVSYLTDMPKVSWDEGKY